MRFENHDILVLRQGFSGEHGYEIWVPREIGPKIWEMVKEAGKEFDIQPVGSLALDIARVEAGLIIPGYDYTGAGPREDMAGAGIFASSEFVASPYELNMGHFIDFSSGKFIGYEKLTVMDKASGCKKLVGIEIDWKDLPNSEPREFKKVKWYPVRAYQINKEIGFVTSIVWSPTLKKVIGFGHLDLEATDKESKIQLQWDDNNLITASICSFPFYDSKRST